MVKYRFGSLNLNIKAFQNNSEKRKECYSRNAIVRTEFDIYVYYFKMATIALRERRSCVHDEWNRYFVTVYQVMMATAKRPKSWLQFYILEHLVCLYC